MVLVVVALEVVGLLVVVVVVVVVVLLVVGRLVVLRVVVGFTGVLIDGRPTMQSCGSGSDLDFHPVFRPVFYRKEPKLVKQYFS